MHLKYKNDYICKPNEYSVMTKREKILEFTTQLIAEEGVSGSPMAQIAKKAGIKSFGLRVEPDKIVKGGKPNSAYVRGLIAQMIDQLNDKEKTDKGRKLKGSGFGKQFSKQKIKF